MKNNNISTNIRNIIVTFEKFVIVFVNSVSSCKHFVLRSRCKFMFYGVTNNANGLLIIQQEVAMRFLFWVNMFAQRCKVFVYYCKYFKYSAPENLNIDSKFWHKGTNFPYAVANLSSPYVLLLVNLRTNFTASVQKLDTTAQAKIKMPHHLLQSS